MSKPTVRSANLVAYPLAEAHWVSEDQQGAMELGVIASEADMRAAMAEMLRQCGEQAQRDDLYAGSVTGVDAEGYPVDVDASDLI